MEFFSKKAGYSFILPDIKKINELSQEPLLLFMLAVYDFSGSELQKISKESSFNQSKLYDSLLEEFGIRQLEKEDNYLHAKPEIQNYERELFRLRLGMIALLMFQNDTTHKDIQRLEDELEMCGLNNSKIKPIDVLTGFFFVHQNKSTSENELESFDYEFLHKSFGEFLAADFILRIAKNLTNRDNKNEELFRFCFGYNWLYKHPEILKFLFEHSKDIFTTEPQKLNLEEKIQDILEKILDQELNHFPIASFSVSVKPKDKIEHIAIFSQNLIFLWGSLKKEKFNFKVFPKNSSNLKSNEEDENPSYNAQDREEIEPNKLLWKRMSNLWSMVGNYHSTAKLHERFIVEQNGTVSLKTRSGFYEVKHNFYNSSMVSLNDFDYILSLFDKDNKLEKEGNYLNRLSTIFKAKPELEKLAIDALIHRFYHFYKLYNSKYFDFLIKYSFSENQERDLINQIMSHSDAVTESGLINLARKILTNTNRYSASHLKLVRYILSNYRIPPIRLMGNDDMFHREIFEYRSNGDPEYTIQLFKLIKEWSDQFSMRQFHPKMMDEMIHRLGKDFKYMVRDQPKLALEYLKYISKTGNSNIKERYLDPDFIREIFERTYREIWEERRSPQFMYDFLKLINKWSDQFSMRQFHPKMMDEMIHRLDKDFKYMVRNQPKLALEYLKFISKADKSNIEIIDIDPDFIKEIFERTFIELQEEIRNPQFMYDFLKLINEWSDQFSMRQFHTRMVDEIGHRLIKDIKYMIREQPKLALEYLLFLMKFFDKKEFDSFLRSTNLSNKDPEKVIEGLRAINSILSI